MVYSSSSSSLYTRISLYLLSPHRKKNIINHLSFIPRRNYTSNYRLAEVGKFEVAKLTGQYETGQLFMHRVFGYRGVVLFPWLARVYDRDVPNKKEHKPLEESMNYNQVGKEVKGRAHTYYQVLIDSRDCPYIRAQTEAVTFLGNQDNGRTLYAVPGLDYIAHEDVMPYSTTTNSLTKRPIRHDLFDKFLAHDENKG
ncbi:hypothetical protein Pcinc_042879 [Petrolisthes cinctipes]|uniref:Hemimethylated DNA-binding domain-containing protein n=1 Tax=Petrolisthes cinctipes TaxID=88211 RepID=A0AAE1BIP0_PETCI|nr:hypothetical protein Pcinc_042879 [Petrolisthes cinctipes]